MFGKNKKKKTDKEKIEDVLPKDEPEEALPEPEKKEGKLPKAKKAATKKEPGTKGGFSLNLNEMTLAVNALAASEEFKVYRQMVIGEQIAEIIAAYNKAVGEKDGIPSEDTEEELPEPT